MTNARHGAAAVLAALGLGVAAGPAAGQISLDARAEVARLEHRVRFDGLVEPSSGTVFGGALGVVIGERFEVWGEAVGGHLAAASANGEPSDFAHVQLLGGMHLHPWLTLQGGLSVFTYATPLARQHWTALRLGAEADVPLALDGLRGIVRGQWMPVVSVSGLAHPDVGLAAGTGIEWAGSRVSVAAIYSLERYDFPPSGGVQRLEELASLQLRATVRLRPGGRGASGATTSP